MYPVMLQLLLTVPDCVFPEPTPRKARKRARSSEQLIATEDRLEAMESYMKRIGVSIPATETMCVSGDHEMRRRTGSPGESMENTSTCGTVDDSFDQNKFVTSQHAIGKGGGDYQGYSGDKAFIQRMREKLRDWPGSEAHRRLILPDRPVPDLFDPDRGLATAACLPPKDKAQILIDAALDTHSLFPILHRPTFDYCCNLLYTVGVYDYGVQELRFLPLLYAVLALGCVSVQQGVEGFSREQIMAEGCGSCKSNQGMKANLA